MRNCFLVISPFSLVLFGFGRMLWIRIRVGLKHFSIVLTPKSVRAFVVHVSGLFGTYQAHARRHTYHYPRMLNKEMSDKIWYIRRNTMKRHKHQKRFNVHYYLIYPFSIMVWYYNTLTQKQTQPQSHMHMVHRVIFEEP